MRCDCGYCTTALDIFRTRQIRLPVRTRFSVPTFTVVALIIRLTPSGDFVVRFASGEIAKGLECATRIAFTKKGMRADVRKNYNTCWVVNIKGVGSLPIVSLHDKVIVNGNTDQEPFFSPVCASTFDVVDVRSAVEQNANLHRLVVAGHKYVKEKAHPSKRQKCNDNFLVQLAEDDDTPCCEWNINAPSPEWTSENVCAFLSCNMDAAPILLRIDDIFFTDAIPDVMARFLHPISDEEVVVRMPSSIMYAVPQYKDAVQAAVG